MLTPRTEFSFRCCPAVGLVLARHLQLWPLKDSDTKAEAEVSDQHQTSPCRTGFYLLLMQNKKFLGFLMCHQLGRCWKLLGKSKQPGLPHPDLIIRSPKDRDLPSATLCDRKKSKFRSLQHLACFSLISRQDAGSTAEGKTKIILN